MARFELYKDGRGEYRWRLKSANGQVIATGGVGYASEARCLNSIEAVKRDAWAAGVENKASGSYTPPRLHGNIEVSTPVALREVEMSAWGYSVKAATVNETGEEVFVLTGPNAALVVGPEDKLVILMEDDMDQTRLEDFKRTLTGKFGDRVELLAGPKGIVVMREDRKEGAD